MDARKNQKGFTLIELMIVIAIIGILSAIAVPNFVAYRAKAKDSKVMTDLKSFYKAAIAELAVNQGETTYGAGNFPPTFQPYEDLVFDGNFTIENDGSITCTVTARFADESDRVFALDSTGGVTLVP